MVVVVQEELPAQPLSLLAPNFCENVHICPEPVMWKLEDRTKWSVCQKETDGFPEGGSHLAWCPICRESPCPGPSLVQAEDSLHCSLFFPQAPRCYPRRFNSSRRPRGTLRLIQGMKVREDVEVTGPASTHLVSLQGAGVWAAMGAPDPFLTVLPWVPGAQETGPTMTLTEMFTSSTLITHVFIFLWLVWI